MVPQQPSRSSRSQASDSAQRDANIHCAYRNGLTTRFRRHTTTLGASMKMNRLIPMLPVRSMPASVDFYEKLGFSIEQRNDDWRWAMLCFGECRLMVDESINVHPGIPRSSVLYLYPDDISEFHKQVRRNGLVAPDLEVTFYGMTEFRIDDPDGNRLWIGQNASTGA